jgi:hypothetical protein
VVQTARVSIPRLRTGGLDAEHRQRHARETNAEFLQRRAARDGLSQTLCEFIEFVLHNLVCLFAIAAAG